MSIWTSSQPNLKFAWWNTLQQSVDTTVTIFCWKVALAEMLIVVLDNQKQPSEVFCKEIVLKDFSNFTGKPVPSSLQLYNFIRKRFQHTDVFLWNLRLFFFLFWISILKNTWERLLLENTYNSIYALLNTSS